MEKRELVQRVNRWYVSEDCIQIMIPYQNAITILSDGGIVYHHKEGSELFINAYMEDERRKRFPYHNIPTHYERKGIKYTNQLLEYDTPYFRIGNGRIIESFAVRDKDEALIIHKVLAHNSTTTYLTREELEHRLEPMPNEELIYLYLDGSMVKDEYFKLPSEKEILERIKSELNRNANEFINYCRGNPNSKVGAYFNNNPLFLDFIDQSLDLLDLSKMKLPLDLTGNNTLLLISFRDNDITITGVNITFVSPNYYKVVFTDIPVTNYTLEQIKFLNPKIEKSGEPIVPLKLNPGVTKEDIESAKQMVKTFKNR